VAWTPADIPNQSGRTAVVTGANGGLGLETARALAAANAHVVMAARNQDKANAAVAEIRDEVPGASLEVVALDLGSQKSVRSAAGLILDAHGKLDILVNNAGITKDQLMLRMKRDDWDAVLGTNLTAAFALTQAALKPMLKQRGGRIVCISSVVGQSGNPGQANYAASKAGLIGFAKSVALEVASRGITVNVVAPGLIDTDMTRAITGSAHEEWAAKIPLKRLGTPGDIASAVCFLASDEASYITGQVLAVNGGMYM
jgi:3-oxoacyl-[acyl-carrier protein] reductase